MSCSVPYGPSGPPGQATESAGQILSPALALQPNGAGANQFSFNCSIWREIGWIAGSALLRQWGFTEGFDLFGGINGGGTTDRVGRALNALCASISSSDWRSRNIIIDTSQLASGGDVKITVLSVDPDNTRIVPTSPASVNPISQPRTVSYGLPKTPMSFTSYPGYTPVSTAFHYPSPTDAITPKPGGQVLGSLSSNSLIGNTVPGPAPYGYSLGRNDRIGTLNVAAANGAQYIGKLGYGYAPCNRWRGLSLTQKQADVKRAFPVLNAASLASVVSCIDAYCSGPQTYVQSPNSAGQLDAAPFGSASSSVPTGSPGTPVVPPDSSMAGYTVGTFALTVIAVGIGYWMLTKPTEPWDIYDNAKTVKYVAPARGPSPSVSAWSEPATAVYAPAAPRSSRSKRKSKPRSSARSSKRRPSGRRRRRGYP